MTTSRGPLLRLVHSLERRRAGRPYTLSLKLSRVGASTQGDALVPLSSSLVEAQGPRTFVVGNGERVDVVGPTGLLPRHLAIVCVPREDGVYLRALSLHPERGLIHLRGRPPPPPQDGADGALPLPSAMGGVMGFARLDVLFDGFVLEIAGDLERPPDVPRLPSEDDIGLLPRGEQLAFFAGASVRPLGTVVSSVTGPGAGGHAIPALVAAPIGPEVELGSLVLRSRGGIHRVEPSPQDLRRGILVGRSRRCVLGRGFDENDGLSRLHALVMALDDGVYAFDLASRYGLRDVARPNRLVHAARLDDGVGCLVYGAGHLVFER